MQLCLLFPFQMARTKTKAAKVIVSDTHHPSSSTPLAPTEIPPAANKSKTFNKDSQTIGLFLFMKSTTQTVVSIRRER